MASVSDFTRADLDRQINTLTKELTALKKTVSKRGAAYLEDGREAAWDHYSDLADRVRDSLPAIRKQGRAIERTARDHPATTAAAGLIVVGVLAALLLSRR